VSGAAPDGVRRLPYPHARNDCVMCRERDADFHVPARDLPNGYKALYCRQCIGEFMITEAVFSRSSDVPRGAPAAIEYEVLSPTREPWLAPGRLRVVSDRL
jgi:hypothetical protein